MNLSSSYIRTKRNAQPEPQAWLLSFFSCLLFLSFGYFCILGGTLLYHQSATNSLLEELDNGRFGAARKLLESCITAPPFKSLLVFNKSKSVDSIETFEGSISQNLYDAFVYLHEGKNKDAKQQIEQIDPRFLISNLADLRENLDVKSPHKRINLLFSAEQKKNAALKAFKEVSEDITQILYSHMKTAKDFSSFFSLDSAYLDYPNIEYPLVYTSGVLKDLPKLRQIPDNIVDLNELQLRLQAAGGRVRTSQTNAAKEYEEKITSLRDKSLSEVYEFNRLNDRKRDEKNIYNVTLARYNSEKRLLEETLKRLIKLRASEAYLKHLDPPFWLQALLIGSGRFL